MYHAAMALALLVAANVTVVDGDTIRDGATTWRLLGYDTPETIYAKCEAEYRLGLRAKDRLSQLIDGAESVELVDSGKRDKYRRGLGDLVIDGESAAALMVPDYARAYDGNGRRRGWCEGRD